MRHCKLKKADKRRTPFIQEIRTPLPKPKLPRSIFWKTHGSGKPSR